MRLSFEKPILILSPHADDWFLGCYYFIEKYGGKVIIFSGSGWKEEQKQVDDETREAWAKSGGQSGNWSLDIKPYEARHLEKNQANILDDVFKAVSDMNPSLLLLPGSSHQDHQTVLREGYRAALNKRRCTIFYYFPHIADHRVNFEDVTPSITLMLDPWIAGKKQKIFDEVWKTQHHRREYCQLGDRELYELGRHVE